MKLACLLLTYFLACSIRKRRRNKRILNPPMPESENVKMGVFLRHLRAVTFCVFKMCSLNCMTLRNFQLFLCVDIVFFFLVFNQDWSLLDRRPSDDVQEVKLALGEVDFQQLISFVFSSFLVDENWCYNLDSLFQFNLVV